MLVPNATVFTETLINLTRRGKRRTRVTIGIDDRDDHDAVVAFLRAGELRSVYGTTSARRPRSGA